MSPSIQEVKTKHESRLMELPGVVSVGVGKDKDGRMVIIIGVDRPRPELADRLPEKLDGYPVVVQVVGEIKPQ